MSLMPPRARATICAGLMTVLACESDTAGPDGPGPEPEPLSTPLVLAMAPGDAGDGQEAFRGTVLPRPLRVRVSRDGAPVAGVPVTWTPYLTPASGTVTGHGPTDADGIATATWALAGAGSLQVAAELENRARVPFRAKSLPASIEILSGDDQEAVVGQPLPEAVRVRITFGGEPLAGETIVVHGAGAYVAQPSDADGETAVQVTMNHRAGAQLYSFRTEADGPQSTLRLVKAHALPDAPWQVVWSGPTGGVVNHTGGGTGVQALDQFGNPVPGTEVSWRFVEQPVLSLKERIRPRSTVTAPGRT